MEFSSKEFKASLETSADLKRIASALESIADNLEAVREVDHANDGSRRDFVRVATR